MKFISFLCKKPESLDKKRRKSIIEDEMMDQT